MCTRWTRLLVVSSIDLVLTAFYLVWNCIRVHGELFVVRLNFAVCGSLDDAVLETKCLSLGTYKRYSWL